MADQDATLIPAGLSGDLSLSGPSALWATDDNGDAVQFTVAQVDGKVVNPVRTTHSIGAAAGGAIGVHRFMKRVTAIPNNSATAVLTITVPNAAHSAKVKIDMLAICGAGGAIGTNEAIAELEATIRITRTPGVGTGFNVTTRETSQTQNVSGGTTLTTFSVAVSSISGAASAPQSFTLTVTIARNSGSADNHKCLMEVTVINENATGVTVA